MNKFKEPYKFEPTNPRNPEPVEMVMKFDEPKTGESKHGPWWKYSVKINGEDETIFATKGLHNALENTMYKAGDTLSVIRTGEGKETRWDVLNTKDAGLAKDTPPPARPAPRQQNTRAPSDNGFETFTNNMIRYKVAFQKALEFRAEVQEVIDLNAVAFTFYRMASDSGYDLINEWEGSDRLELDDEFPPDMPL